MLRRNNIFIIIGILIVIGWRLWLFCHPSTQTSSQQSSRGMIFGVVEKVYDGDTFEVRTVEGKLEKVRLMGINTPEVSGPYRHAECYGGEASQFMKQLLPEGAQVTIIAEGASFTYDQYHRMLGYAYQGRHDLTTSSSQEHELPSINEQLLAAGYAREYTYHHQSYRLQSLFQNIEYHTRQEQKGLWRACHE